MSTLKTGMICTIVFYLLAMIVIGIRASKKTKDVKDFYLGGRKLGPFMTAMSAEASDMSSYLLMGIPGLAYFSGIADAGWTAFGLIVGTYLNWLITARRLRDYTSQIHAITIPDYLKKRFHDKNNITLLIGAITIILFFIPYTASGFAACGKLFHSLFGADYHVAMIISAIIIIAYTCTGGFLAASTTDLVQSIIMSIALAGILIYAVVSAGGISSVIDNAGQLKGFLDMNHTHNNVTGEGDAYSIFHKITMFCWGLGYFGMPHILLRFMAIEEPSKLKTSRRVASIWCLVSLSVAAFLGIVGRALSIKGSLPDLIDKADLTSSAKAETLIIELSQKISHSGLFFALLAGFVIAGILASTMSTADSQLIAASSAVSENLMQDVFHIKMDKKQAMFAARVTLVIIAMIALFIAWNPNSSVFTIVSFAWAGFGAVFGPVILLSLYWKRANLFGAISGMLVGLATVFIWKYAVRPMGGFWDLYELAPAFLISLLVIVIVSLLTKQPEDEIYEEFQRATKAS